MKPELNSEHISRKYWNLVEKAKFGEHGDCRKARTALFEFVANDKFLQLEQLRLVHEIFLSLLSDAYDKTPLTRYLRDGMTVDTFQNYLNLVIALGEGVFCEVLDNAAGEKAISVLSEYEAVGYYESFAYVFQDEDDDKGNKDDKDADDAEGDVDISTEYLSLQAKDVVTALDTLLDRVEAAVDKEEESFRCENLTSLRVHINEVIPSIEAIEKTVKMLDN